MPNADPTATTSDPSARAGIPSAMNHSPAVSVLSDACARSRSLLSVGLEPASSRLPAGFDDSIEGHERFMMAIAEAADGIAAAVKFNLAFFEALGPDGVAMMHRVRDRLPEGLYVIADAKRGDIGSSAERYAESLYHRFRAHSCTVNPLMGTDAVEPFLAYEDRVTFLLTLTSNPGAEDFLTQSGLFERIADRVERWNSRGNCGMVIGATRPELAERIREIAPSPPALVPGVGAQGGDAGRAIAATRIQGDWPGILVHATRSVLPKAGEDGDPVAIMRARMSKLRDRLNEAAGWGAQ